MLGAECRLTLQRSRGISNHTLELYNFKKERSLLTLTLYISAIIEYNNILFYTNMNVIVIIDWSDFKVHAFSIMIFIGIAGKLYLSYVKQFGL